MFSCIEKPVLTERKRSFRQAHGGQSIILGHGDITEAPPGSPGQVHAVRPL